MYGNLQTSFEWAIPEKSSNMTVEDILFWKNTHGIFRFVTLPSEIPEETSFHPWKFCKIGWHTLKSQIKIKQIKKNKQHDWLEISIVSDNSNKHNRVYIKNLQAPPYKV